MKLFASRSVLRRAVPPLLALCVSAAWVLHAADTGEAYSREVSAFVPAPETPAASEAIAREVSLFLPDDGVGIAAEAVSREISVFLPLEESLVAPEAISRELSLFLPGDEGVSPPEAISRELSLLLPENDDDLVRPEAISRELSLFLPDDETGGGGTQEAISRELSLLLPEPIPRPEGLLAWWRGEGNGADAVGTNHAALTAGVRFVPGVVGGAFRLDGAGEAAVADAPGVSVRTAISLVAWVRADGLPGHPQHIAHQYDADARQSAWEAYLDPDGRLFFGVYPAYTSSGVRRRTAHPVIVPGQWTCVAFTFDAATGVMAVYQDGEAAEVVSGGLENPGFTEIMDASVPIVMGHRWSGELDEVMLFDRALTAAEVGALHQAGASGVEPRLPVDLVAIAISGPAAASAGASVPIVWTVTNASPYALAGPRRDALFLSADAAIGDDLPLAVVEVAGELAAGGGQTITRSLILPAGLSGIYWLVARVDSDDGVWEPGAEDNNAVISAQPISISSADLVVTGLITSAAEAVAGAAFEAEWVVENQGTAAATARWQDGLYLAAAPDALAEAWLLAALPAPVTLEPGARYTNRARLTLPLAAGLPAGGYVVAAYANADHAQPEASLDNNVATAPLALALPPLPDLLAGPPAAPAALVPGQTVEVTWAVTNTGSGTAPSLWIETLHLVGEDAGRLVPAELPGLLAATPVLAELAVTAPLPPGAGLVRTQQVRLPSNLPAGTWLLAVRVDAGEAVVEANETDNAAAGETVTVPLALAWQVPAEAVREDASPFQALLLRNGGLADGLEAALTASPPARLLLPDTVRFAPGEASAAVTLTPRADGLVTGPVLARLTATAAGHHAAAAEVTVLDVDLPALALVLETNRVAEGRAVTATVRRTGPVDRPVVVVLSSPTPSQFILPAPVTIPAGAAENSFTVLAADDSLLEGDQDHTLIASAPGHAAAEAMVTILDDDLPQLALEVSPDTFSEGGGPQAAALTVRRSAASPRALVVALDTDRPDAVRVPATVTIPAFNTAASVPVAAVDNAEVDPPRAVVITAQARLSGGAAPAGGTVTAAVTVTDDDGPTLSLTLARTALREGDATTATVRRNTGTAGDLAVTLAASDPAAATLPPQVILRDGAAAAEFTVSALEDGVPAGSRPVTLTAAAGGFTAGTARLTVTDADLPDLVVAEVAAPATMRVGERPSLTFRVANLGVAPVRSRFVQRVFLSRDALVGDDILVGNYDLTPAGDSFGPGRSLEQTVTGFPFTEAGDFWLVVTADVEEAVAELDEANNTRLAAVPIRVEPDFTATVQVDLPGRAAPAGTPVPLSGTALRPDGRPAVGRRVDVHLALREFRRVLSAVTGADGRFQLTFQPLHGEAGRYTVGAARGGEPAAAPQDAFTLHGARFEPAAAAVRVDEASSLVGRALLRNAGETPLTGLAVAVAGGGDGLTVTAQADAAEIGGQGFTQVHYTLTAAALPGGETRRPREVALVLQATTAEGGTAELPLRVTIEPLRPRLRTEPAELVAGMVRGGQKVVEFTVVNEGRADTGPLALTLPDAPWLRPAGPAALPALPPGGSNTVTLLLAPDADLPLGPYTGQLALHGPAAGLRVPFTFRCVSEARGDLQVTAVDEFTYYAEGAPRVTNAMVVIRDTVTGTNEWTRRTDAAGTVILTNLLEGRYEIEVSAPDHGAYRGTAHVIPGQTNEVTAFVPRELVKYTWTVEPTEVEDRTRIAVETTFEANVPAPVITIDPSYINLRDAVPPLGSLVTNITIRNRGLIKVHDAQIQLPEPNGYRYKLPTTFLGELGPLSEMTIPLVIESDEDLPDPAIAVRLMEVNPRHARKASPSIDCDIGDWAKVSDLDAIPPIPVGALLCGKSVIIGELHVSFSSDEPPNLSSDGTEWFDGERITLRFMPNAYGNRLMEKCNFRFIQTIVSELCDAQGPTFKKEKFCLPPTCPPIPLNDAPMFGWWCIHETRFDRKFTRPYYNDLKITMSDRPTTSDLGSNGNLAIKSLCFSTHLVLEGKGVQAMYGPNAFVVLAGIRWGTRATFDPSSPLGYREEVAGPVVDFDLPTLTTGLSHGGFDAAGWRPIDGRVQPVDCCGTFEMAALGVLAKYVCGVWLVNRLADCVLDPFCNKCELPAMFFPQNSSGRSWGSTEDSSLGAFSMPPPQIIANSFCTSPLSIHSAFLNSGSGRNAALSTADSSTGDGVCARVKLRFEQEAVFTRSAFKASLEIENRDGDALRDLRVDLRFRTPAGQDAAALFGVRAPVLDGITGVDGAGAIAPLSTGAATWILIPTLEAAPAGPTQYLVGGTLGYTQNGARVTVPLADVPITVHPGPELVVDYFHQRDVFSDDPFTAEVEPAVPYALGVMVRNLGRGEARNFRLTSGQPQVVENEKGLLIDFQLVGAELHGQGLLPASAPSLTAHFGNIPPGSNVVGRWLFTSSLQGLFIDYAASFEHLDAIAGRRISLITNVAIHEMIRSVAAPGPFADGRPDFLVNDRPDLEDLPDTVWLSDGTTRPVAVVRETAGRPAAPPAGGGEVAVTVAAPPGFAYVRLPDPAGASGPTGLRLAGVRRGDGRGLPGENFWTTDRTFLGLGQRPRRENLVHLFDHDPSGSYVLTYVPAGAADRTPPVSRVEPLPPAVPAEFPVRWSGTDDGPGPLRFDVEVSVDGGPFTPWLREVTETGALYRGEAGRSYAFFTVARDAAGNREARPASPQAETTATWLNRPPRLQPIADQQVAAGEEFRLQVLAEDPDGDPFSLSLLEGPLGLTLEAGGVLRWPTGPARGRTVHPVLVQVRDAGVPPLADQAPFQITVVGRNTPPVAATDTLVRPAAKPGRMPEGRLLANDSDAEGDPIRLLGVATTSANGGTIRRSEGWLTYTPPPGEDAPDEFTYTISDGTDEAVGRVLVTVGDADGSPSLNILGLAVQPDGRVIVSLAGIPGRQYALQVATSLAAPAWTTVSVLTADANGRFTFVHENPPPAAAFYRAVEHVPSAPAASPTTR
jgi:hypothetical protein